jgi:hypothetical protein
MKVFLGGTRKVERLPGEIIEIIENEISRKSSFLIGDAAGSDRAFQKFLSTKECSVTIYSSANRVRNNIGNWPVELIDSGLRTKSNAMHSVKDRIMSDRCDYALMLWDTHSVGTLTNVLDVVSKGKRVILYNWLDSEISQFEDGTSLESYCNNYETIYREAIKRLKRDAKRMNKLFYTSSKKTETLF